MTEKRLDNQTREEIARINNCHIGSIVYYNEIIKFYKDILYVEITEASKLKIVCIPDYDADTVNEFIENELMIGVEYEIVVEETANMDFDIDEYVPDEFLEKLGFTRETFKESNVKALLESMVLGMEDVIQEETLRLMREYGLSYGEARTVAIERVRESIRDGSFFYKKGE